MVDEVDKPIRSDGSGVVDESQFQPATDTVPSQINVASDEHPLKQVLGDEAHRKLEAHEGTLGERFAFRYKEAKAFIREYLANAETGCIRRSRYELTEHDPETYDEAWFKAHSIPELFEEVRSVTGYHPMIEIHNAPAGSNEDRFRIEDNGIGISVHEFVALKKMGLSGNHEHGDQLGSFGQGIMSVFNAVGRYGDLTITTWSCLDDANYSFRLKIDGTNDLTGARNEYGTTFSISAFADEARDLDVEEAIEQYTEGMYAPVLHHKYDASGVEEAKEEYTYTPLEDLLPDDAPRVTYEDDYIEVVASPTIGSGRNNQIPKTFLVTMPIDRSDSGGSYDSPWGFHIRIKDENGPVYHCTHDDDDHTDLIPVSDERYREELINGRDAIHPGQLVPGDLVGYYVEENDTYVVPRGEDDELVASRDDLELPPKDGGSGGGLRDSYPNPIDGWPAKIVDGSHEGCDLVTEDEWHDIDTDVVEKFVPRSELNLVDWNEIDHYDECDVALPSPVDDRDRLAEHGDELFGVASRKIDEEFENRATDLFETFATDGFDSWYTLEQNERHLFTKALEMKINSKQGMHPDIIIDRTDAFFDVDLSDGVAEKLSKLFHGVEHAPRNTSTPNRQSGRTDKKIKDVLIEAGKDGDVYMSAAVSTSKAELAWEIHEDNQVVSVNGSDKYTEYEKLFDWIPLKELSLYDIDQYDIPDDVASRLGRTKDQSSSNNGGWSGELVPETREVKIRGAQDRHYQSATAKEIADALNSGDRISSPHYDSVSYATHLVIFRETVVGGVKAGKGACHGPIARAVVPNYVADYLEDVDNCHVVEDLEYDPIINDIRSTMASETVETISLDPYIEHTDDGIDVETDPGTDPDRTTETIDDLGPETLVLVPSDRLKDVINCPDEYDFVDQTSALGVVCNSLDHSNYLETKHERIVITDEGTINETTLAWGATDRAYANSSDSPQIFRHTDASSVAPPTRTWNPSNSVYMDLILPKDVFDRDAPEWNATAGEQSWNIKRGRSSGEATVDLLHHLARVVPDDEPIFPSQS